jgi:hypothetical protein
MRRITRRGTLCWEIAEFLTGADVSPATHGELVCRCRGPLFRCTCVVAYRIMIRRSEIENALDDLVAHEQGAKFQAFAVVLAKRRWPELIACERKKDLGADAHAPARLAPDGVGKALACSLTATLGKIRADANAIKENFDDVTVLIYATPHPVTNQTGEQWRREIREQFGYDLTIVSREDYVTTLLDPSNAGLGRIHLDLQIAIERDVDDLLAAARAAAAEIRDTWLRRTKDQPLLDLPLRVHRPQAREMSPQELASELRVGWRVVLEAPAGRGKTTTLVQMASHFASIGHLSVLIDLPVWVRSRLGILDFVSGMAQFRSRLLDGDALARTWALEPCVFLLNGWNEVAEEYSGAALELLADLERQFPAAGIVVATRTHHVAPPLPGAVRALLLPLRRDDRRDYLERRLGVRADALLERLNADEALDALTRTPFILARLADVYEATGAVPASKFAVLQAVVESVERSIEHGGALRLPPLNGRASEYLAHLAEVMTSEGRVTLSDGQARELISMTSVQLRDQGQLAHVPEPSSVANALCARHVLDRSEYPETLFRFEHHQLQEFYAGTVVRSRLLALGSEPTGVHEFTRTYLNEPAWDEPLRIVAAEIGRGEQPLDVVAAGASLVQMASAVDRVFAAQLARLCGPVVWAKVRGTFEPLLREWYAVEDENHRACALAAMIATGTDAFADVIEPWLAGPDDTRVPSLRSIEGLGTQHLGPDWVRMVRTWNENARRSFVLDLLHNGAATEEVVTLALADPSMAVRAAVTEELTWYGTEEDVIRGLLTLDEATLIELVRRMDNDRVPGSWRPRAAALLDASARQSTTIGEKLRLTLRAIELGAAELVPKLKGYLDNLERGRVHDSRPAIAEVLDIVKRHDAEWVSRWLGARRAEGWLLGEDWSPYLEPISEEARESLFAALTHGEVQHGRQEGIVSVLVGGADVALVARAFKAACDMRRQIAAAPSERHERAWAVERQMVDFIRAVRGEVAVSGVLGSLSAGWEPTECAVVTRVFGDMAHRERDLRSELDHDTRKAFRAYLINCVAFAVNEADFRGTLKVHLAWSLAHVGEPEDIDLLRQLIRVDLERVRTGRAVRTAGDYHSERAQGASMCQARWHLRAAIRLNEQEGADLAVALLSEPEYELAAAAILGDLCMRDRPRPAIGYRRDYVAIWKARAKPADLPSPCGPLVAAIKGRVESALGEWKASADRAALYRLSELAKTLVLVDPIGSSSVIFEVLAQPIAHHHWAARDMLEALLFGGIVLPAKESVGIIDRIIESARASHDNQRVWLEKTLVCMLPYVDPPGEGIGRARTLILAPGFPSYDVGDVMLALGHSRAGEALQLLCELLGAEAPRAREVAEAWLPAVSALGTPESRALLVDLVERRKADTPMLPKDMRPDSLAVHVAAAVQDDPEARARLYALCDADVSPSQRAALVAIMGRLGSVDALVAALNLLDDASRTPLPYELWRAFEMTFVEHRPHGESGHTFTLVPRDANQVRAKLMAMSVADVRRRKSASKLLAQIEVWRLDHGRPLGEPRHPAIDTGAPWPAIDALA